MPTGPDQGPPASPKQISYIRALVEQAGLGDLKSARRELELTQRQSNGKFTAREASALIDRLKGIEPREPTEEEANLADPRLDVLRGMPAGLLALELERRGWSVSSPDR